MSGLWLWLVLGTFTLEGYTGFHLARGGWHGTAWQTPVGLASLGIRGRVCPYGTVSLRFLFFDLLRGSRHTPTYAPYLQEAALSLQWGTTGTLTLGHQLLSYRDGFFLTDIGDGMDALRLSWHPTSEARVDLFYVLQGNRAFGDRPTGDFLGLYWRHSMLDLYAALRTDGTGLLWLGARAQAPFRHLNLVAEAVGLRNGTRWYPAAQAYLRWHHSRGTLGAGAYYLHRRWQKPVAYPSVMDNFYNGWTAFGEALNWVVLPLELAPLVSSASAGDPYAVYWPDPHNLWVLNLNHQQALGNLFSFRLDLFGYGLAEDPETQKTLVFLGPEAAGTLTLQCQGFTLGLSGGVFWPHAGLSTRKPAWNLRIWGFAPFEVLWSPPMLQGS